METCQTHQKRYPPELRERAVRMVLEARAADPSDTGIITRISKQLGVGTESLRNWVKQTQIDTGERPGTTTEEPSGSPSSRRRTASSSGPTRSCAGRRRISPRRSSTARGSDRRLHRRQPRRARGRAHLQGSAGGPEHVLRGEVPAALGPGSVRDAMLIPLLVTLWKANFRVYGVRKLWKAARAPAMTSDATRWPASWVQPASKGCAGARTQDHQA